MLFPISKSNNLDRFEATDLKDGCQVALMYVAWLSGAVKDREKHQLRVCGRFEATDLKDGCQVALMYVAWLSGAVKDREYNH
ncbi:hypothetical protein O9G_004991 [Rozella allomycis CSF55]|uniref:Uncharacterized protein n=1 Tax=Rozella allomycis (strain CSF55) TaxID=988480 RepID=A0A075AZP6_ROZAC|nr:hypothetical protein O9G_004991 [Rozella allomycis CSF55]|eukprot:EPZ34054.1 hypothetical protein O9G_004991 [Rozella allomycis CSF55]